MLAFSFDIALRASHLALTDPFIFALFNRDQLGVTLVTF